jgi:transaldolase
MTAVQMLHDEGQSFWLDQITREMLTSGALARSIDKLGVAGVASNLETLRRAIEHGSAYNRPIRRKSDEGKGSERALSELLLEDAVWAADLLRLIWHRASGMDGWVTSALSPRLFRDSGGMLEEATDVYLSAHRPNLLVEIPGTEEGLVAVEHAIARGIPVNVTMLFSAQQYRGAADAYLRGLERRIVTRRPPEVGSVASLSVGRFRELPSKIGLALAKEAYKAYRALLRSPRWQRLFQAGARPQRLVWATRARTTHASEIRHVKALAAPFTAIAAPLRALKVLGGQCLQGAVRAPVDGALSYPGPGIDVDALASRLQDEAVQASLRTWLAILEAIDSKRPPVLRKAG